VAERRLAPPRGGWSGEMTTSENGARTPKGAEPARADAAAGVAEHPAAPAGTRLLFVSAGLGLAGGGIAAAGRLLLGATAEWARRRGVHLRLLTLGEADEVPAGIEGAGFAGDRARLAAAVWRAQALEGFRVHVYDFLG